MKTIIECSFCIEFATWKLIGDNEGQYISKNRRYFCEKCRQLHVPSYLNEKLISLKVGQIAKPSVYIPETFDLGTNSIRWRNLLA